MEPGQQRQSAWSAPRPAGSPELVGRHEELRVLAGVIDQGAVRGAALVVRGDPGIGKSALLAAAQRAARARRFRVLAAVGVQSEAQLPFAGLHQLLHPLGDWVRDLPPVQREAFLSAFGLFDGPRPELFLVALAAANLLASAAADHPLVVVADDVQWLDPQSQEALTFVAHRAAGNPIVVIGGVRTGHPGPFASAGLPELEVRGVDDAAAQEILLSYASDLGAADRRRIQHEARGNPLALLELPTTWRGPDAPATDLQPPSLSARLEQAFASRITDLTARTRDALLVSAVDLAGELAEVLAATSALSGEEVAADVLAPAAAARLVTVGDGLVEFWHPLVRSGVLQSETVTRRLAANAALATVLVDEPYRRTWHRAQSIVGPDDEVADELEANVSVALRRGGVISAIADLERAAQLTSSSARRGHRLLLAAEHAFSLGRGALVDRLVQAASRTDLSDLDRARMEWLREIFHDGVAGDATRVVELCGTAARSACAGDHDLALNLLLSAALRCWADTAPAARARVVEVTRQLSGVEDDPRYIAALGVAEPVLAGGLVVDLLARAGTEDVVDADALRLLGMAAHAVGDEVRAADFLDRAETMLRDQGRLGLLPHVLSMQVQVRAELGEWDRATAAAEEGKRLARETGQPIWSAGTLGCDARVSALRGEVDQAFRLAAEAELAANRRRLNDLLSGVQLARGSAWLSAGRYADAYAALRRLFDPADPSFHQRERFAGLTYLAEAAVRSGQTDHARTVVADLEHVATVTPSPILHVHLFHARALLADEADAEHRYLSALAADLTRWPWIKARIELAYGTWLRRHARTGEARSHLGSAKAILDLIGARAWADEARAELWAVEHGAAVLGLPLDVVPRQPQRTSPSLNGGPGSSPGRYVR
jgi:tetratricopeptide (TPR) repeat protein